jgi:hypothetical protein
MLQRKRGEGTTKAETSRNRTGRPPIFLRTEIEKSLRLSIRIEARSSRRNHAKWNRLGKGAKRNHLKRKNHHKTNHPK